MTMTLIGRTQSGALLFTSGPGDDPCMVCAVDPDTHEVGPMAPLAALREPWEILQLFDREAWGALFAEDQDGDIDDTAENS